MANEEPSNNYNIMIWKEQ